MKHRIVDDQIEQYCTSHCSEDPVQSRKIAEQTRQHAAGHMMVGQIIGSLLRLLASSPEVTRVLEIGTFTGYSASLIASALSAGSSLITIEQDHETWETATNNLQNFRFDCEVSVVNDEGMNWLIANSGSEQFDLIFIDGDKESFFDHLSLLYENLRKQGMLLVDNSLCRGRAIRQADTLGSMTHAWNRKLASDSRFVVSMLPIRDGLLLARKVF